MWTPDSFLARPEDAIAFAWQAPMRELAARIGISDVALRKLFSKQGIVAPPLGHWNRVRAGRSVIKPPRPPVRKPGGTGRIRLDARFREHVAEAGSLSEHGPFATKAVPEDLEQLREQELKALGKIAAPRDLSRAHFGLARLLRAEAARRVKASASRWNWDEPHFDGPLAQRQLRLLSGLLNALAKCGHTGEVWGDNQVLAARCIIGNTPLDLKFAVLGNHRTELRGGVRLPARDLPAKTPLQLVLTQPLRAKLTSAWQDQNDLPLERQLAVIAADLITAGEARFRQSLVEAREHAEKMRTWREESARKEREERNRARLGLLEQSGVLLRQADELRLLVERVRQAVVNGSLAVSASELAAWQAWANARADALDPVLSGQVLSHIRSPE